MNVLLRGLLLVAVVLAIATEPAPRTRTASTPRVTATLARDELSPGDRAAIELTANGGLAVAIREVTVAGLGTYRVHAPWWRSRIESRLDERVSDRAVIHVPIPETLLDRRAALDLEVRLTTAEGFFQFENVDSTHSLSLEVFVRSPVASRVRVALAWARPLAVWLAAIPLLVWGLGWLRRRELENAAIVVLMLHAGLGFVWFAPHALRLVGQSGVIASLVATVCWTLAFAAAALLEEPSRLARYRIDRVEQTPVQPIELAHAIIGAAGLYVVERARRLVVTRANGHEVAIIRLPKSGILDGAPLAIDASHRELVLDLMAPLSQALGTLRCQAPGLGEVVVNGELRWVAG